MRFPSDVSSGRPFWLQPKWIFGHVLVVALVILAVNLGFWQLRRLDERRAVNAEVASRIDRDPVPIDELVGPDAGADAGDAVRYRRVTATGTYDAAGEVLVRSRSLNGQPGYWVVTPLELDDGSAVAVNRGWVPYTDDLDAALAAGPPPDGTVRVEGMLFGTEERQGIGPTDPAEGQLQALARLDVDRLDRQLDADLLPVSLQLEEQRPPQEGALPTPVPPPTQDEGSHLAYAGQWFLFAAIGAIGWPVLLRHTARERGGMGGPPAPQGPDRPAVEPGPVSA